jgi:hypothetical protein
MPTWISDADDQSTHAKQVCFWPIFRRPRSWTDVSL